MVHKQTLPYDEGASIPIDTLRVEVIDGPDEGLSFIAETETVTVGTAKGNDVVLTDPTVSRYHAELERTSDVVLVRDHGSTNGTLAGTVRIQNGSVPPGTKLRLGATTLQVGEGGRKHVTVYEEERLGDLSGRSEGMRRLMTQIQRVARTEASVLIVGESGTGKELIARAVHDEGARSSGPFVTVDCGAIAPNLVASELFGHEKGAFTGADRQHVGAFERADGGTIFLDEIGELPPELQPNLLGALERRRFRRVGGQKDITVNVRVVAATNRDLRSEVNDGRFRLDLYYRVAVVTLKVPPLRARPTDLSLLIERFLRECGHEGPMAELFPEDLLRQLEAHHWPGNVRELRNLVEATVAMGEAHLDSVHDDSAPSGDEDGIGVRSILPLAYKEARARILHEFEKRYLGYWLERAGGNVAKAAREARMDRSHLFHLLRRHDLR
ncbi:MAG: sigma 54-interacting transcriptional regulator [Myxococcota bacterium]